VFRRIAEIKEEIDGENVAALCHSIIFIYYSLYPQVYVKGLSKGGWLFTIQMLELLKEISLITELMLWLIVLMECSV